MLDFMSEEIEPVPTTGLPARKPSPVELAVASARENLSRYMGRAVEIITELAEGAENERVRLAAAESILDRTGVGKTSTQQVEVGSAGEHEAARRSADEVMKAFNKNKRDMSKEPADISLEALIVHEGDDPVDTTAS